MGVKSFTVIYDKGFPAFFLCCFTRSHIYLLRQNTPTILLQKQSIEAEWSALIHHDASRGHAHRG